MIWHLLAVFIAGLSLGGMAYLLRQLSRQRLPKWIIPVFASIGMLGYLAYYDYTWYEFKTQQLPADAIVIDSTRNTSFFRPWSYVAPAVSAFRVADGQFTTREQAGARIVEYLVYEFTKDPTEHMQVRLHVLNCERHEVVSVDRKRPENGPYLDPISPGNPIYRKYCLTSSAS
jgi:hypothetical protein